MTVSKIKCVILVLCAFSVLALGGLGFNNWGLAQMPTEGGGGSASAPSPKSKDDEKSSKIRERSLKNLKDIAAAADRYLIEKGVFPNNILSSNRKLLLSWRVAILPYLGHKDLYSQFKLDESWDSEHNLKLLSKMPDVFRTGTEAKDATSTFYQGFADVDSMFPPGEVVRIHDVIDGTANTLLAIEAAEAVTWTKPADLPYSPNRPLPQLGGPFREVIHAVFVEGTPISIKRNFNEEHMRLAITRADGKEQNGRNLAEDNPPRDPKPPKKGDPEVALKRALELAAKEREAALEALRQAERERNEAERKHDDLTKARITAENARKEAVMLKKENDELKAAIREMAAKLDKPGVPAKTPEAEQLKAHDKELKRIQAELRRLSEEVARLKKPPQRTPRILR